MTLSILITRFPGLLSAAALDPKPLTVIAPLLTHSRPAVRKRAIITLAQFVPISQPQLFSDLLQKDVLPVITGGSSAEKQQIMVQLIAAVARHSSNQIAPVLGEIVPGILKALKQDSEDLRESGLQTLEVLVLRCPAEVTPFLSQIVQAGSLYIKYDPVWE
jgi:cullin-associated NEDD8-dissociated protein 1